MHKQISKNTTTPLIISCTLLYICICHLTVTINALPTTDQSFFTSQSNNDNNIDILNERIFTGPDIIPTLASAFSQVADFANDVVAVAAGGGGRDVALVRSLRFDASVVKPHVHLVKREVFGKLCDYFGLCVDFGVEVVVEVDDEDNDDRENDRKGRLQLQIEESSKRNALDRFGEVKGQEWGQTVMGIESVHANKEDDDNDASAVADADTTASSYFGSTADAELEMDEDTISAKMTESAIETHLLEARKLFNRDMGMPQYTRYMAARKHATNLNFPELEKVVLEMREYATERLNEREKLQKRDVQSNGLPVDSNQQRASADSASQTTNTAQYGREDGDIEPNMERTYSQKGKTNMDTADKTQERYLKSTGQTKIQPARRRSTEPVPRKQSDKTRVKKQGYEKNAKSYASSRSPQDL